VSWQLLEAHCMVALHRRILGLALKPENLMFKLLKILAIQGLEDVKLTRLFKDGATILEMVTQ
jgi:hypothetical protein